MPGFAGHPDLQVPAAAAHAKHRPHAAVMFRHASMPLDKVDIAHQPPLPGDLRTARGFPNESLQSSLPPPAPPSHEDFEGPVTASQGLAAVMCSLRKRLGKENSNAKN